MTLNLTLTVVAFSSHHAGDDLALALAVRKLLLLRLGSSGKGESDSTPTATITHGIGASCLGGLAQAQASRGCVGGLEDGWGVRLHRGDNLKNGPLEGRLGAELKGLEARKALVEAMLRLRHGVSGLGYGQGWG